MQDGDKATESKSVKEIGHEARKPLVSLINTAALLLAGLEGELSDQVRSDIDAIKRNAQEALKAVDILVSRLDRT